MDPRSIEDSDGMDGIVKAGSLGSSTLGISTLGTSNGKADTVDEAAFAAEEATFDAVDFALAAIVVAAELGAGEVAVVFLATFFLGVVVLAVAFFGVVFSVMMRPCSRE